MSKMINEASQRRELRRRKILENSELRKQKILGLTELDNTKNTIENQSNTEEFIDNTFNTFTNDVDTTPEAIEEMKPIKINESRYEKNTLDDNEGLPEYRLDEHNYEFENTAENIFLRNENNIENSCISNSSKIINNSLPYSSNNSAHNIGENGQLNKISNTLYYLEHPAAPAILALIVSILVTLNIDSVVSHSFILPFFLWELQYIISAQWSFKSKTTPGIIEMVILLCGVKKDIVIKYLWLLKLIREILEDFSIYICIITLWDLFIGFPAE